jgi:hypothetical protein
MITFVKGRQRRHYCGPNRTVATAASSIGIAEADLAAWRIVIDAKFDQEVFARTLGVTLGSTRSTRDQKRSLFGSF